MGLSEQAAARLMSPAFNTGMLNRLAEHKRFPYLLDLVALYCSGGAAEGVMARNELLGLAMSALEDFRKENPELTEEIRQDRLLLNSQKMGKGEAELEQIKNTFISILRDIRKDMEEEKPDSPVLMQEQWQRMMEQADGAAKQPTADDVAEAVAKAVGQIGMLDASGMEMLQQVTKQMLENSGK